MALLGRCLALNFTQTKLRKMKKLVLFGAIFAMAASITSCGGGEEETEASEPKEVTLSGHTEAMALGGFDIVVSVGKYVDNYSDDEVNDLVTKGKKLVQVEIKVINITDVDLMLPPAAFKLDKVSTDKKENIGVHNLISMKLDDYNMYDGDVGTYYNKGVLYYELDKDAKVSDYQLNVLNVLSGDEYAGSIPLAEGKGKKDAAENTEISLANASFEIEDIVFDGIGTLMIDKAIDNYTGEEVEKDAYTKFVRINYTVSCTTGKIYASTSDLQMVSDFIQNPDFSIEDDLEGGAVEAGNSVSGFAIFEVPAGDSNYTLIYSDDYEMAIK